MNEKYLQGPWFTAILHCPLPLPQTSSLVVSLVPSQGCETRISNALTVQESKALEEKKKIMLCTAGILYPRPGFAVRLVEWMELQREMGVDKV